jgi:hypothetical protein
MRGYALVAFALGGALMFGIGCKKDEAAPSAAVDPNSTGVAECDAYLKAMNDCYAGTPQEAQIKQSTSALREKLKADATANKDKTKADCIEHQTLLAKNPVCTKK